MYSDSRRSDGKEGKEKEKKKRVRPGLWKTNRTDKTVPGKF